MKEDLDKIFTNGTSTQKQFNSEQRHAKKVVYPALREKLDDMHEQRS